MKRTKVIIDDIGASESGCIGLTSIKVSENPEDIIKILSVRNVGSNDTYFCPLGDIKFLEKIITNTSTIPDRNAYAHNLINSFSPEIEFKDGCIKLTDESLNYIEKLRESLRCWISGRYTL